MPSHQDRRHKIHGTPAPAVKRVPSRLEILEKYIRDDGFAITFQTMGQYRNALLGLIADLKVRRGK